jgi:hypothetical protein
MFRYLILTAALLSAAVAIPVGAQAAWAGQNSIAAEAGGSPAAAAGAYHGSVDSSGGMNSAGAEAGSGGR